MEVSNDETSQALHDELIATGFSEEGIALPDDHHEYTSPDKSMGTRGFVRVKRTDGGQQDDWRVVAVISKKDLVSVGNFLPDSKGGQYYTGDEHSHGEHERVFLVRDAETNSETGERISSKLMKSVSYKTFMEWQEEKKRNEERREEAQRRAEDPRLEAKREYSRAIDNMLAAWAKANPGQVEKWRAAYQQHLRYAFENDHVMSHGDDPEEDFWQWMRGQVAGNLVIAQTI
ncbi:hypothetical protein FWG95_02070 [Candidatus Saccharibacteria bacterium]|nr:hypothetical protein [Candidatus Saccharibacteria bacterium]